MLFCASFAALIIVINGLATTTPNFKFYSKVETHTCVQTMPGLEVIELNNVCGTILSPCYPNNYTTDVSEGFLMWYLNISHPLSAIRLTFNEFEINDALNSVLHIGRSVTINGNATGFYRVISEYDAYGSLRDTNSSNPFHFVEHNPTNTLTQINSRTYEISNISYSLFLSFTSSLADPLVGFNISYCADIDQCQTGNVSGCMNGGFCQRNSFDNYSCSCPKNYTGTFCEQDVDECVSGLNDCDVNALCVNTNGSYECFCGSRYTGNGTTCIDINECSNGMSNCSLNSVCVNTNGSFTCACNAGFAPFGLDCLDIDECSQSPPMCHPNATCLNDIGTFQCFCNLGFTGDGLVCADINACSASSNLCNTSATCVNSTGSPQCVCNAGYTGDGVNCTDIDECSQSPPVCHANATCSNVVGSFQCSCNTGFTENGTTCIDINECSSGKSNCSVNSVCVNTNGSFTCECNAGFAPFGLDCVDIDECSQSPPVCHTNATCSNVIGIFQCSCNTGFSGDGLVCSDIDECSQSPPVCHANATCSNVMGTFKCFCNLGFTGDGFACAAECSSFSNFCNTSATCVNSTGSPQCVCNAGYAGDGVNCTDIDECNQSPPMCHTNATCSNVVGSFQCSCITGYTGDGLVCSDINECIGSSNFCHTNGTCVNSPGSYQCVCNAGYTGDGFNCTDVNECRQSPPVCHANATCSNVVGMFQCSCITGYAGDGLVCADIDECSGLSNMCHTNATCSNVVGTFQCACNTGFTGDGLLCSDIDECSESAILCDSHATCTNIVGSYRCVCLAGYNGDGSFCTASPPHPIPGISPVVNVSQDLRGSPRQNAFAVQNPCTLAPDLFPNINPATTSLELIVRESVLGPVTTIGTWATSIGQTPIAAYTAAIISCPPDIAVAFGSRKRRALTADNGRFVVGQDTNCDRRQVSQTCNGPLPPDRAFQVALRSVVDGVTSPLTNFSADIRTAVMPTCIGIVCTESSVCEVVSSDGGATLSAECVCDHTTTDCQAICHARTIVSSSGTVLNFRQTFAGLIGYSDTLCEFSGQPIASIPCVNVTTGESGQSYGRFDIARLSLIPCTNTSLAEVVSTTDVSTINSTTLEQTLITLDVMTANVSRLSVNDTQATIDFINTVQTQSTVQLTEFSYQRLVDIGDHVTNFLNQSTNDQNATLTNVTSFVQSLTELGYRVAFQDNATTLNVITPRIAARVERIQNPYMPVIYEPFVYVEGLLQSPATITIPQEAIATQMSGQNNNITGVFLFHTTNNLFPSTEPTTYNVVISGQVRGSGGVRQVANLQQPVVTTYQEDTVRGINQDDATLQAKYVNHTCVFWNFTTEAWSTDGCFVIPNSDPPQCRCNHLTNFAMLVHVYDVQPHISLQIVTYVCASLSIVCLVITFVILIALKDIRKRRPIQVLMNICALLIVVFILFIAGADNRENESQCAAVAFLLHYFLLCAWCWMSVYAYFLYMAIVKVFYSNNSRFLKIGAGLSYGIPAVIASINAIIVEATKQQSLESPVHGQDRPSAFATSYLAENMCWIKGYSLYFSFLLPFGIMLIFNIVMFVIVIRKLVWGRKQVSDSTKKTSSPTHHTQIAITTATTLGLSWFFAFFMMLSSSPGYLTAMSWLFSLTAGLQGVGIFLFTVVKKGDIQIRVRSFLKDRGCPCSVPAGSSTSLKSNEAKYSVPNRSQSTAA